MRDLTRLPKGHLHLHLEGAMRPETLAELAANYGMAMPTVSGFGSFTAFVGMYQAACEVLRTPDDLARLVTEVVEDAATAGAVWVEPALWPVHHRETLGPDEAVVEYVLDAARAASARTGVGVGLIVAADRTVDPAEAVALARIAARFAGRGVVGFGLANDEVGYPPEPFAPAFTIAREAGLLSVPHAGELEGPASVRGALDALGADRIQHGIRVVEDPELLARVIGESVCLDVCPTSNVLLAVVASMAEHPLPALLRAGARCSVNADDPLLFGSGLAAEYEVCRLELGLSDLELADVARASVAYSGAPEGLKAPALAGIDAWLAAPA
jgi:adenosine deaminase